MGNLDTTKTQQSDFTNQVKEYEVTPLNVNEAKDLDETTWTNDRASIQWGWFNSNPDLKSALVMKAIWDVGKGYTADASTTVTLEHIRGNGKQSFRDILFSMEIMKRIYGDAFAEIITDTKTGKLINLKLLNPANIRIVYNKFGDIIRYEQFNKPNDAKPTKWKPEEILHFQNLSMCGQIHGISEIDVLEPTLKADEESFADVRKVMHNQAIPMILWKLKTDDTTKITDFVTKVNRARSLGGENLFIPDDDNLVTHELVEINLSAAIFEWRNDIRNKFYRNIGLPQIIPGAGGNSTESESKVIYTAYGNIVENDQKYVEEQIWAQLYLRIDLIPPESLIPQLQSDTRKDTGQMGVTAGEMSPGGSA
ncbi:MAG: phage portal protein [Clostridia bacterium]|nr:phage portal protein [Clostridia bacterium]